MGSPKITFQFQDKTKKKLTSVDVVIVPVFQKETTSSKKSEKAKKSKDKDPVAQIQWPETFTDKSLLTAIKSWAETEQFSGAAATFTTLPLNHKIAGLTTKRLILVGLGTQEKFKPQYWQKAICKAFEQAVKLYKLESVSCLLPEDPDNLPASLSLVLAVDAAHQATYQSMEAKQPDKKQLPSVYFSFLAPSSLSSTALKASLDEGIALAEAKNLVKDLVNHPSNLKTPTTLVTHAKAIAKPKGPILVDIKTNVSWIEKNMPCFFEVARGSVSSDPPKFIHLAYKPQKAPKKQIALIGKSVIFDTGGYQVKPGNYMNTMKGDMTGGAVVLGVMQALSKLKLNNLEVHAYLAATPNKIDSYAMLPDSIVDTSCGKKVEIRHTDAEGRLTLIDAVTQAAKNNPDEMISVATLTGAASIAVGRTIALMANNTDLRDRIQVAGQYLQEPIQPLDVVETDFDDIKSALDGADIRNTSTQKYRGAQSAAAFVMSGLPEEDLPMAHLDIAGADMTPDEKATGFSVTTLIQFLLNEDSRLNAASTKKTSSSKG
ncbi:MAG: leucyl aminopeptidase family protein [Cyanobacteria bacterium P01_H01_bin.74]